MKIQETRSKKITINFRSPLELILSSCPDSLMAQLAIFFHDLADPP